MTRRCAGYVQRAFDDAGFVFVSDAEDPVTTMLREACPRLWVSPSAGPWVTYVHYWDDKGMQSWQRLMPAEWSVTTAFHFLFPKCQETREQLHFPKTPAQ